MKSGSVPRQLRLQDVATGEVATNDGEVSYIVDDPYLVFTLGDQDILVHPDEVVNGRVLTVHMGGAEFRELRVNGGQGADTTGLSHRSATIGVAGFGDPVAPSTEGEPPS